MNTNTNDTARSEADAAVVAALAVPYEATAKEIGGKLKQLDNLKGGIWRTVRASIGIAVDAGHDVSSYRQGMAQAMVDAEVKAGSIRSYMDTASKLLELIATGKADKDSVLKLSIHDARKLVPNKRAPRQTDGTKATGKAGEALEASSEAVELVKHHNASGSARKAQLSALMRAITRLDDDALAELVELAEEMTTVSTGEDGIEDGAAETVAEALAA